MAFRLWYFLKLARILFFPRKFNIEVTNRNFSLHFFFQNFNKLNACPCAYMSLWRPQFWVFYLACSMHWWIPILVVQQYWGHGNIVEVRYNIPVPFWTTAIRSHWAQFISVGQGKTVCRCLFELVCSVVAVINGLALVFTSNGARSERNIRYLPITVKNQPSPFSWQW